MKIKAKFLYWLGAIIFVIPFWLYWLGGGKFLNFDAENRYGNSTWPFIGQFFVYVIALSIYIYVYFKILKVSDEFKSIKEILCCIGISCFLFWLIPPFLSSDIYYYMGVGRLDGEYGQNPYYVTMNEYVEQNYSKEEITEDLLLKDEVLYRGYTNSWAKTTMTYGPIWSTILSKITFSSNLNFTMILFKILNSICIITSCYYIYKLSGKNKLALLYGLNPFTLIIGISGLHNDIVIVTLLLISLYWLKNKKSFFGSLLLLSFAANIKFNMILFLPFFVLYYVREQSIGKRFISCIKYGLLFCLMYFVPYLLYYEDTSIFISSFVQVGRFSRSFWVCLLLIFWDNYDIVNAMYTIVIIGFVLGYIVYCFKMLFRKNLYFYKELERLFFILMIFTFGLLTNFQIWYMLWFTVFLFGQKPKYVKFIIALQLVVLVNQCIYIGLDSNWKLDCVFVVITFQYMVIRWMIKVLKKAKKTALI